jgi:hypothetical protein
MDPAIPQDLATFIWEAIDRLETLETLLLLQASPEKTWTLHQLMQEMRSSQLAAEQTTTVLVSRGLLSLENNAYCFRPRTPELEAMAVRLAACYRERRVAVIRTIFSRPNDAITSFANAFRIKKEGSDG